MRRETGQHLDVRPPAIGVATIVRIEVNPELDIRADERRRLHEVGGEHANDAHGSEDLADGVRIAAEAPLPTFVADDGTPFTAGNHLVAVTGKSSEERFHRQQVEESFLDVRYLENLGGVLPRRVEPASPFDRRGALESAHAPLEVPEVGERDAVELLHPLAPLDPLQAGRRVADDDEPVGIAV